MEILRTHEYGFALVRGGHLEGPHVFGFLIHAKYFHGEMMFPMSVIFLLCIFRVEFSEHDLQKMYNINGAVQYFCFCIFVYYSGQRPGISLVPL